MRCQLVASLLVTFLTACDNMADQPKLERNEATALLPGGTAAQPLPVGTVPRESPWGETSLVQGQLDANAWRADLPIPLDAQTLRQGREVYSVFCAVCHGPAGYGDGIVVRRGFPPPPSYHSDRLRGARTGYLFDVVSHGYGAMPAFAERITPTDRWAVVAYVRALQWSQHPADADFPASTSAPGEGGAP